MSLIVLIVTVTAGADDKKKQTNNPPPPPPPQHNNAPQVARPAPQAARPTPPPQRSTNTYHPPNTGTGNTYHPPNTRTTNTSRTTNTGTTNTYHPPAGTTNTYHPPNNSTGNNGTGNANPRGVYVKPNANTARPGGSTPANKTYTPAGPVNSTVNKNPGNIGPANHTTEFNKGGPGNVRGNEHGGPSGNPASKNVHTYQPVRTTRDFGDKHVAYDRRGQVREIHGRGIEVHRSVRGTRTFVAERNGRRIVGLGPHRGYMEHAYLRRNGRVYVQRTYVVGGVRYARVYRSYYWNGGVYYHYVPAFYYRPAFYGWVYNPWPVRVAWGWGWGAAPWYGFYGYYFAPYPVYPSASFWLTDYVVSQNLQLAYAAQQEANDGGDDQGAGAPPAQDVQLTPEVKQMIADEVQRQLAAEQAASGTNNQQSTAPPPQEETPTALDANSRIFIVSNNLDVVKDDGNECTLTAGDVILRTGATPDGAKITINVITSKRNDCASNTNTAVEVSDLQEMQNQFREQIDSGLKVLADNQGKSGLPNAPDTSTTGGEVPPPAPDSSAEADLQEQQKSADQAEADVRKSGGTPQN